MSKDLKNNNTEYFGSFGKFCTTNFKIYFTCKPLNKTIININSKAEQIPNKN